MPKAALGARVELVGRVELGEEQRHGGGSSDGSPDHNFNRQLRRERANHSFDRGGVDQLLDNGCRLRYSRPDGREDVFIGRAAAIDF